MTHSHRLPVLFVESVVKYDEVSNRFVDPQGEYVGTKLQKLKARSSR